MTWSPAELAHRLGLPAPTAEQEVAIASPLAPAVVVAGAGSGKTETMAARVGWLVANRLVRPEQVLGLTFTRKAARELATRIRRRLGQLAALGVLADDPALLDGEPTVVTYDAFASRIVAEHALRLGREPGVRLVTEAVCWQYATRVVESYDGEMHHVFHAPSTVADQILQLHAELAGHLVELSAIADFTAAFRKEIDALPQIAARRHYAAVEKALAVQEARSQLVALVEAFRAVKQAEQVVDFADQAELAARLAEHFPEVGQVEREQFRVVLLDEYQDTSHAQLVLLRSLFADGHPVTAVGDPCQSIYGWRGARAGSLTAFRGQFLDSAGSKAVQATLTTSFRNGARILQVANRLAEPLRAAGFDVPLLSTSRGMRPGDGGSGVVGRKDSSGRTRTLARASLGFLAAPVADEVGRMRSRPRLAAPDATRDLDGQVVVSLHLSADDEAADIARRVRAHWEAAGDRRTTAVLVRARSQIPRIEAALRAMDVPVQVVGVGGLLTTPEVADVVATLRVLADPDRGDALLRLLTGARWRIGPRDLAALSRWARRLAGGTGSNDPKPDPDGRSLVEALDSLPEAGFSAEGRRRLGQLSAELRAIRGRAGQPLPDLLYDVVRTLGVDVEVMARRGPSGRANLDRLLEVAAEFAAAGERPTLSAFLAYLDAAETAERGLRPGDVEVSDDQVQVLTVHSAKGLEWDAVFVAGLVDGVFPAGYPRDKAWLAKPGVLPYPLRGDAATLPRLRLENAADQRGVRDALQQFAQECGAAERLEERRLAYVATTRARRLLVCSGYWWGEGTKARPPSQFLIEIRAACAAGAGEIGCWIDEPGEDNPLDGAQAVHRWPYDPLGARRPLLDAGAALVQDAIAGADRTDPVADAEIAAAAAEWDVEVQRLLAEREHASTNRPADVPLPTELSVSRLVLLHADPDGLARAIRRPVPSRPAPLARRGTLFHAWLESRWRSPQLLDVDELPGWADAGAAPDRELAALQAAFLDSQWAGRTPLEVETPFELLAGGVLIRGRADAVFATDDGGIDVVDWKTGAPPRNRAEAASLDMQLAAYRLAFARISGLDIDRVRAAFHYVRENVTSRPADLYDEAQLGALLGSVPPALEP